ncbi:MAG: cobalamin B12-binding domain-containing protein, partial [Candidatus Saganbacteria bacterium]|nr:cobalamin B12-binding domain-containing protein [Candidatus Saganbacteria bacterium]
MRTRASALLVNYAGYPSQPNSLMPDNGLASLAKQLKFAGHKVKILDYATVDTMRRLTPPFFQKRLEKVLARAKDGKKVRAFAELKVLAKVLGFHRLMEERRIAREIGGVVRENEVDLLGFKLWSGDGYSGPVRMAGLLKKRFPNLLVVAGGPQVKFFEDRIFSLTGNFDVLAVGDGEATILPLAEVVLGRDLGEVPNIYYRKDGIPTFTRKEQISDMDSLPFPIYDEEIYPAMA